jgi:hypothetical protein
MTRMSLRDIIPGRVLGNARTAGKLQTGDAPFALRHKGKSTRPRFQRQLGGVEYGSRSERNLRAACGTLIKGTTFNHTFGGACVLHIFAVVSFSAHCADDF